MTTERRDSMTDPKARERLVAILEQANSDSWKIGATVEEILAAGFRLPEAAPSGNEAVEAARRIAEQGERRARGQQWKADYDGAILCARYILSLAPQMPPTPVNSLPTQSVSLAPGKDALEMAREVLRTIGHYKLHGASGIGTWEVFDEDHVDKVATAITAAVAAAVEKERDVCAKVAIYQGHPITAEMIRARRTP